MKTFWKILVSIAVTAALVGGGTYYYIDTNTKNERQNLQSQFDSLKKQITSLNQQVSSLNKELSLSRQKIVVYGDTRTGHEIHEKIVKLITAENPIAVFHTGDLVDDGTVADQWATFNQITNELVANTNFYPALGNHERDSQLFYSNFELPNNEQWYSVNSNGIHFIILDSNKSLAIGSSQYIWLENDLKNIGEKIKFTAVIFHHPPFNTGMHDEDEQGLKNSIVPLFEQYGVDVVFNGHDHNYERSLSNNIYYIVTGGGGAPLYEQKRESSASQKFVSTYHYCLLEILNNELIVSVFDLESKLIDKVTIKGG